MLILGLLLLIAAGALTAGMLLGNTDSRTVEVFGQTVDVFSDGELFAIGVATGIIAGLSLGLALSGMRRSSRKRRERRTELKAKRSRELELQDENARLARELDQQRRASGAESAPTAARGRSGGPGAPGGPGASSFPGTPDSGADRTQHQAPSSGDFSRPTPAGSQNDPSGYGRPSGPPAQAPPSHASPSQAPPPQAPPPQAPPSQAPPSQAPPSSADVSQEGRRPLS